MDVIFDLDGTLADLTHRRHHLMSRPKNWKAFFAAAHLDTVIEPVAIVARLLALGNRIIVCSGRPDDLRQVSETWLAKMWGAACRHDALYMRKTGDYRPDDVVKGELLDRILADGYRPELVFDDRKRVVDMWRQRGLVCAQVAEGNF